MKKEKTLCEYCKKKIERGKLRCEECNKVWENGVEFGKKAISFELRNVLDKLKELANLKK